MVARALDGAPAREQRALQQVPRGDAFAGGDDGVRGAKGAERGGHGEGLAGGARAVDHEGRRAGSRGLRGDVSIDEVYSRRWKGQCTERRVLK